MKYTVYKITNKVNGKIYVGKHQTKDINDGYMGSGKMLKRAIKKYGIENFIKEVLHVFDTEEEMNLKEAELVTEEFCIRDDTYNLCVGGQGGFGYINNNGISGQKIGSIAGSRKRQYLLETNPEFKKNSILHSKMGGLTRTSNMTDEERKELAKYARSCRSTLSQSQETRDKISSAKKGTGLGNKNGAVSIICDGIVFPSYKEAAAHLGCSTETIRNRVKSGIYQKHKIDKRKYYA